MPCKNCKFFKKTRNIPFGECSNDEVFQYAEDREDLKEIGNNTLVIVGEGEAMVGLEYQCSSYVSKKDAQKETLNSTGDFQKGNQNFVPPAKKKRGKSGLELTGPSFMKKPSTRDIKFSNPYAEPPIYAPSPSKSRRDSTETF